MFDSMSTAGHRNQFNCVRNVSLGNCAIDKLFIL